MSFVKYLHAVGTGPKGNRDLSLDESKDMMEQIINQKIPDAQISAFLLGWRLKPETVTEFKGALEVCDEYIQQTTVKNSLELGYPFDGKAKNPYMFPLVAKLLEPEGLNLVVCGDKLAPAKGGITLQTIAQNIELNSNIYYFDRKDFSPELSKLSELRMTLGLRTAFNTIEKLPHVARSEYAITGVFHRPYVKKYTEIFASRYKKFALIQGNEGTPEFFSKGRIWIINEDEAKEHIIDPKHYGINYTKSIENISLEDSLKQLNEPSQEYLKLAKLNAAIYLFVTQRYKSVDDAWQSLN